MSTLLVHACGPQSLIEDRGRVGLRSSGVGVSGAADRASFALANRLVGNITNAAAIECLFGGLSISADGTVAVAETGADAPIMVDGTAVAHASIIWLHAGQHLTLGQPKRGLRSYLAVRGGIAVDPILGSRSTDTLSGLGPPALSAGDRVAIGCDRVALPALDVAPVAFPWTGVVQLRVMLGPRENWFADPDVLSRGTWRASAHSNRIGLRLDRIGDDPVLQRSFSGELPTEAISLGSIQVPPSGQPVIFLADHPVTGGYPVVGVLVETDIDYAAQIVPGQEVSFRISK